MNDLKERLRRRGWTDKDIEKAVAIIDQGKKKKSQNIIFLDSIVYWLVLFVALIGNFIISIILIPFMLAVSGLKLILIIGLIGFVFGSFFDMLLRDIQNIENKEIVIAGVFLPLLALINVGLMVKFANFLKETLRLINPEHDPIVIALVYVISFILPHIINMIIDYTKLDKSQRALPKF